MCPLENSQKCECWDSQSWFCYCFFVCIWLVCVGTDVIHVNVHHRSLGPEGNPLIYLHSSPFEQTKQRKIPREPTFLIILQVPIPLSAPPRCSHIIKTSQSSEMQTKRRINKNKSLYDTFKLRKTKFRQESLER